MGLIATTVRQNSNQAFAERRVIDTDLTVPEVLEAAVCWVSDYKANNSKVESEERIAQRRKASAQRREMGEPRGVGGKLRAFWLDIMATPPGQTDSVLFHVGYPTARVDGREIAIDPAAVPNLSEPFLWLSWGQPVARVRGGKAFNRSGAQPWLALLELIDDRWCLGLRKWCELDNGRIANAERYLELRDGLADVLGGRSIGSSPS